MAALENQMQSMLPSADEDTRSTEEYLQHPLETVPFFQRPIGSSTKDLKIGEDDAGNPVFQTSMGNEYTVKLNPDQRTLRKKVSDAIPVVKEAVTDYIEDPKLPTKEQLSEFAKQAGQSAVESVEDLGDLMFKGKGTTGDVFGAALGAGTASIPFSVPEGAVRVFGGAGAKKIDTNIFSKAEKLWNKGTPNEEIREQTGWYKDDADRKWRFEIDDSQMKLAGEGEFDWSDPDAITYSEDIMSKAIDGGNYSNTVTLRLGDFLDHKKLFKHYPQLKNYEVILNDTSLGLQTLGSFSPQDKRFSISPQVMQDPEYVKEILIHEIQHGIQEIEGFLPGSNVAESAYLAAKKYTDEADSISKTLESFGFNMNDLYLQHVETLEDQFKNLPLTEDQKYSATKYFARLIDLDNKVQEVGQNEYKYYKNRSGEVEANLASGRRTLTPVQRANLSPIQGKQNTITDKTAYSAVDPTIKRRQGQSDILLDDVDFEYSPSTKNPRLDNFKYKGKEGDYEEMYSARIKDFLKSDSSTRRLSTLKPGSTIKLGPDNQEYIFVRFSRDSLDKSRLNKNYPHVFHEEMGSEEYPMMATAKLIRVPFLKKERTQLIKYVQDMYNPDKKVSFPFKLKSFSLADLMFDSNKGRAKPENTGGFRDSAEENKNFLGLFNKKKSSLGDQAQTARENPNLEPEVEDAFTELANIQRGNPERAMVEAQMLYGGGVLPYALEHVGDLTHRMAERGGRYGAEFVEPKVTRLLNSLLSDYGFEKEMLENIQSNARFKYERETPNIPFEQYKKEYEENIDKALKKYSEAHKKVPVYNNMQLAGREAAIAVGEKRYTDAIEHLYIIDQAIKDGTYKKMSLEFDPNIDFRKKPKDFNKGGTVMNEQMEMAFMQEGGLKDDGMNQDPVSGNEVPSGSMASEVRDDIPAQLSEGEYVVPADVVRYFGVKHFEDLRNKAKGGLNKMEADGRIGGEPVPVGGPKAGLRPDEMQEIQKMFEGGMVAGAANGADFSFYNPTGSTVEEAITTPGPAGRPMYSGEFSFEQPGAGLATPPPVSGTPVPEQQVVTLYGPNGEIVNLMLPKDQAMYDQLIAQGYGVTAPQIVKEKSRRDDDDDKVQTDPNAWMDKYDYTNSGVLMQQSLNALDPKEGIEGMVGKVFGGGIFGQLSSASNAAQIAANIRLLNSQGVDTKELQTKLDTYIKTNNIGWMPKSWIDGDQLEGDVRDQIGGDLFKHGDKAYTVPETKTIMQEAAKDTVREPTKTKEVVDPDTGETKTVITSGTVYKPEGIDVALTPPPDKKKSEPSFHEQYMAAVKKSREKSEASRQAMQRAQDKGGSSKNVADLKKKYEAEGGTWASGGRARGGLMKKKKNKK